MHRRTLLTTVAAALGGATGIARASRETDAPTATPPLSPLATLDVSGAMDFVTDEDAGLAYVAAHDGFVVADVSDPANPVTVAEHRDLLADHENGPLDVIRDVKFSGTRLLVCGQAWVNASSGTAVAAYDVAEPTDPTRLAVHETDHPVHNAAYDGSIAYLTGTQLDRWPVVIVDVSGDASEELARWSVIDVNETWAEVKPGTRRVHDVHLDGDHLYVANWDPGTRVLDVSDPAAPTEVAVLGGRSPQDVLDSEYYRPDDRLDPSVLELPGNSTTSRTNDDGTLLAVPKEAVDMPGDRIGGPGPVDVWDVADLSDPRKLLSLTPPGFENPGPQGNAKNCEWRGDRLYTSWRTDGVRAYDFSTPAEPTLLGEYNDTSFDIHTARALSSGFAGLQHMGPNGGEDKPGRLFTFREPSAENARPAPTGSPLDATTPDRTTVEQVTPEPPGTTTPTATPVPTTPTTAVDGEATETVRGDPPTEAPARSPTDAAPPTGGTTTASGPGFTAVAAVAGVGGAVVSLLRARLRERE